MDNITSVAVGIILLFGIFVYPILKSIQELFQESKTLLVRQNEMIASIHDKIMEIRNHTEEFSLRNHK